MNKENIPRLMQKIILCKGLPASGKSTWAIHYCVMNPEFMRISKNDLRLLIDSVISNDKIEEQIIAAERSLGLAILYNGKSLIIDDTNFSEKHYNYWKKISLELGIALDVMYFDTPVEECIRRDLARENQVGKDVIMKMYKKHVEPNA